MHFLEGSYMKNSVLAIDIGGTNFRIGIVTEDNQLFNYTIKRTDSLFDNGKSIEILIDSIEKFMNEQGKMLKLEAIAIGFPSIISKDKSVVYSSPNIKGFDNINVKEPLESHFSVPVFIENDVNFLLQHELYKKKLFNKGITLGFYIGTGFGNSIYLNDHFLSGKNGAAGELGHIPVLSLQEKCGCGNEGCIEQYASGKRLTFIRDRYFPDTDINDLFGKHVRHDQIINFIEALSIPIATEINIFDPDQIIIGGGVIQMNNFPLDLLEHYILKHTRKPFPALDLNIIYAQMDQTTGLLGAGYYAFQKLDKERVKNLENSTWK
jgi:allose kinase